MKALTLLLSITNKYLESKPNYSQRKKEQFFKLKSDYENELLKERYVRDDNFIDNTRDKLLRFIEAFDSEI